MSSRSRAAAREQDRTTGWLVWTAALVGFALFAMSQALAAVGDQPDPGESATGMDEIITGSIPKGVASITNVQMQFIQQDGPRAGHVKVVLMPDDRPLTLEEARSAARQAFLETLNEPSFMDELKIVTIVVHRFPGQSDPVLDLQMRFRAEGEGRWSVQDLE